MKKKNEMGAHYIVINKVINDICNKKVIKCHVKSSSNTEENWLNLHWFGRHLGQLRQKEEEYKNKMED